MPPSLQYIGPEQFRVTLYNDAGSNL